MALPKMRSLMDSQSIEQKLLEMKQKGIHITLWQSIGDDEKILHEGKVISVDRQKGQITVRPRGSFLFGFGLKVFFYSPLQTVLFNSTLMDSGKDDLTIKFPSEVMVQERRKLPRLDLKEQTVSTITLEGLSPKYSDNRQIRGELLDFSHTGLSFVAEKTNTSQIRNGDLFKIIQLEHSDNPGEESLLVDARVLYNRRFSDSDPTKRRIGLQFI